MVLVAAPGAVSRYSNTVGAPCGGWTTMKPPPPMLPAAGCVTARAKAVATAASTALPPSLRMVRPASDPGADTDTTTPLRNSTPLSPAGAGASQIARTVRPSKKRSIIKSSFPVTPGLWPRQTGLASETRKIIMEIKWHDIDPQTEQKRYLCAERFAGEWSFRWKLTRRGEWTRGLEPTAAMW